MAESLENRKCLETGKTTLNRESVLPYHVFNAQPLVRRDDRSSWANIPLMKVRPFLHMGLGMMFLTMMIIQLVMMFLTMINRDTFASQLKLPFCPIFNPPFDIVIVIQIIEYQ